MTCRQMTTPWPLSPLCRDSIKMLTMSFNSFWSNRITIHLLSADTHQHGTFLWTTTAARSCRRGPGLTVINQGRGSVISSTRAEEERQQFCATVKRHHELTFEVRRLRNAVRATLIAECVDFLFPNFAILNDRVHDIFHLVIVAACMVVFHISVHMFLSCVYERWRGYPDIFNQRRSRQLEHNKHVFGCHVY